MINIFSILVIVGTIDIRFYVKKYIKGIKYFNLRAIFNKIVNQNF